MIRELAREVGVKAACQALRWPRSSYYRSLRPKPARKRAKPARALTLAEREKVRQVLNNEPFVDRAPREVYARLLDQGKYLCHWRTMYRILDTYQEVRERRDQLRHPSYQKPELLATRPKELWSWDITKLLGPRKWNYYYLYVILDVYSRYVVGWMVALQQASHLAKLLFLETCQKQNVQPGQLTLHADRGNPMNSESFALLLADLGVTKTHSRPNVSNDNPYSEAQFKTLKYRPDYPKRFGSLTDARLWCQDFFQWYNHEHYHSGIALMTPADVHYGRTSQVLQARQHVLEAAYQRNPERFVLGCPKPGELPKAVWINSPASKEAFAP